MSDTNSKLEERQRCATAFQVKSHLLNVQKQLEEKQQSEVVLL